MRADPQVLVNQRLDSVDTRVLLKASMLEQQAFWSSARPVATDAVPLVGVGLFAPGVVYPSTAGDGEVFYLPKYILRRQDGRQTTRLARNPPSADPAAPVGSLSIALEALPPPASAPAARAVAHDMALRLGYRIPLAVQPDAQATEGAAALAGRWRNLDPDADGLVALAIVALDAERLEVRGKLGAAPPDAGGSQGQGMYLDGAAMAMLHFPDRMVALRLHLEGEHLRVAEFADLYDPSAPGDALESHAFIRDAADADGGPLIWIELEPPVPDGPTQRRSVTKIVDDEAYLRLFKVMTRGEHAARLEATCSATLGQRSWRQTFVGTKSPVDMLAGQDRQVVSIHKQEALAIHDAGGRLNRGRPGIRPDSGANVLVKRVDGPGSAERDGPAGGGGSGASIGAGAPARFADLTAQRRAELRPGVGRVEVVRPVTQVSSFRPVLRPDAVLRPVPSSEPTPQMRIEMIKAMRHQLGSGRVPSKVVVDRMGIPVVTRRTGASTQVIAPFWFDQSVHAQMFDAPADGEGRLVLLRREIRSGDRAATFYQNGLEPRQVYYEPEEFRLARSDAAPFAPSLLFHLSEEVDADAADPEGLAFSVTLTYRAKPYLHPALLAAARAQFGPDANIAPIDPVVTALRIRMSGEPSTALERSGADIDFADGISDVLSFTEEEYRRLTTALQTVSGVGLEGEVEAVLLDGRTAQIPIRIGLRTTVGRVFDWALTPPTADGRPTLVLRNRIESPVRIDELPAVALGGNAQAAPAATPPAEPVAPGASVSIGYQVTPPDAAVAGFDPAPVASVLPDLLAILAQTTVVQGYASDSFDVEVAIDPLFFDLAPEGMTPLTGVRVDFRTREEPVVLTSAQPRVTVKLQMPLLLFVTNAAEAQHYSYAVTNLHAAGPGASTAFRAGFGDLEVTPAPPGPGVG